MKSVFVSLPQLEKYVALLSLMSLGICESLPPYMIYMVIPPWVGVGAWVDSKLDVNVAILDVNIRTKLQRCEFVWK